MMFVIIHLLWTIARGNIMDKVCIDEVIFERTMLENEHCGIFSKPVCEVLKLFCPDYLDLLDSNGLSLKDKVLNSSSIDGLSEIVIPNTVVYDPDNNFMGYIMPFIDGSSYDEFCNSRFKYAFDVASDLNVYSNEFSVLEEIVLKNNDVVFADLLDRSNIIYNGEKFNFIDYDGIQCNGYLSDLYVLNRGKYVGTKYVNNDSFTKDFDIKQLFELYFNVVFGYNLSSINSFNNVSSIIDLEFNRIGLDSDRVKDCVLKLYSNCDNSLLSDILFYISNNYQLCIDDSYRRFVKRKVR